VHDALAVDMREGGAELCDVAKEGDEVIIRPGAWREVMFFIKEVVIGGWIVCVRGGCQRGGERFTEGLNGACIF